MKHSQQEIDAIWNDVCSGKGEREAAGFAKVVRPCKIVDDAVAQVVFIPDQDGFGESVYARRPGGTWLEL